MYRFWQIHVTTWRNPCINFDKSLLHVREIHVTTLTNPSIWANSKASTDWLTESGTGEAKQWSDFGSADKNSTLREKSKVFATPFFFRTRNRETRDTSPSSPTPSYRRSNGIDKEKSPVSSFLSISCHITSNISFLIPNILAFCQVWLPIFLQKIDHKISTSNLHDRQLPNDKINTGVSSLLSVLFLLLRYCLFFSYFYFDLSQPYYWRLAGVEKEKSPVKTFTQEEIYRVSQYFHQPKRYFPRVDCFCQFLPVLWGTVSSMIYRQI